MKIIKEGKKIPGTMRVTCKRCEAKLEIEAKDLKVMPIDRPTDPRMYHYKCPCCSRENYIGYSNLSEAIRFDLNS